MARYSDAEVEEILRRAIEKQQKDSSGMSHDDLVAAAREVGIEAADVEAAVAEVRRGGDDKAISPVPVDDDAALYLQDRRGRRAKFARHLATYVVVNAFLAGMNLMTGGGWWVLWVLLGWGIGVALHGLGTLLPDDPARREHRTRRLRRRRDREALREREHQRRLEKKRSQKAREKEFEHAVQEGVGLLLSAAARKIEDAVERRREAEGRPRAREGARVAVDDSDDRVRVEVPEREAERVEDAGEAGDDRARHKAR